VSVLRLKCSAFLVVAVMAATNASALLAWQPHDDCPMSQQECPRIPTIRPCCCDGQNSSNQGAPIESRVLVGANLSAVSLPPAISSLVDSPQLFVRVHTSPPRAVPLDLPTLFATLLI
jgi:hypothetical protein